MKDIWFPILLVHLTYVVALDVSFARLAHRGEHLLSQEFHSIDHFDCGRTWYWSEIYDRKESKGPI